MENTTSDFFEDSTTFSTIASIINNVLETTKKSTVPSQESQPQSHKAPLLLYDIAIPTLGTVIIILNLAVVISSGLILKKGQQPRSTYMFLGNVALTDLVTGIAVLLGQLYPKKYRDHYICATQLGLIVSSTLASVYSVGLIAIDRYLFIVHGLRYQIWVYPTRVRVFILTSWIIGIVIGFMPLMGWYGDTDNGRVCWFILLAPKELILLTVVLGIIPLLTVIVLYSMILYKALRKIIQLQEADAATTENAVETNENALRIFRGTASKQATNTIQIKKPNTPNKWKAIKVVMFTTGSFVITWGPYFIASLMYGYCYDKQSSRCNTLRILIASPLAILGFCNSLINPIIYAWWHKGFRNFIMKKYRTIRIKRRVTETTTGPSKGSTSGNTTSKTSSSTNMTNSQAELDCVNTRM